MVAARLSTMLSGDIRCYSWCAEVYVQEENSMKCRVLPFDDDGNVPTVDDFPLDQDIALIRLTFFRM